MERTRPNEGGDVGDNEEDSHGKSRLLTIHSRGGNPIVQARGIDLDCMRPTKLQGISRGKRWRSSPACLLRRRRWRKKPPERSTPQSKRAERLSLRPLPNNVSCQRVPPQIAIACGS